MKSIFTILIDVSTKPTTNMFVKKKTQKNVNAGCIYLCGNCDAFCTDKYSAHKYEFNVGRGEIISTTEYCDSACRNKHIRDTARPIYEENIGIMETELIVLKELLSFNMKEGKKSNILIEAIKMVRQNIQAKTMLLSGEYPLHIMKVEMFKLSEVAMAFAELVAEEEDPNFNSLANEMEIDCITQVQAYNTSMWARQMTENKQQELSFWFE